MKTRDKILELVKQHYKEQFVDTKKPFSKGDRINYGGRYFDEKEIVNLVDSSLDFWLTAGRYAAEFENKLADFLKVRFALGVNSGSSANLLAFMTLTSHLLKERAINRGDEVITVAAGFPTTVTPIIQYGAIPVFVDVTIPEYNIDDTLLEKALSPKTKAIMIAHTLGNPFNLQAIKDFCDKHNLWLIEDNCDSLGSQYLINGKWKYTGTIGDIGTSSFYPPHHITMGEGGAVYTNNPLLNKIAKSMRDWGRDCWCDSGKDGTCNCRFTKQFGKLPVGYDHKYVYSHFGFNFKLTDMQAAVGVAQLDKLKDIISLRRSNWQYLYDNLSSLLQFKEKENCPIILPVAAKNSIPSWFGFMITVSDNATCSRNELIKHLEKNNIQTRMLFAGNLLKHPCFDTLRNDNTKYRVVNNLINTDIIMNNSFWIGVYPGMTKDMLNYMVKAICDKMK